MQLDLTTLDCPFAENVDRLRAVLIRLGFPSA
jgi:hypothetical protein